jgi:4-hydroxybenzoyl-CoA thioesterase
MSKPTDSITAPYVHRRVINWSDTDAAQIVYTVRFLDYVMEAVEGWFRSVVGSSWFEMNVDRGIGTPVVNVNFDFKAPLTPRDELRLTVLVERAGRASITFNILGDRDDGVRSFVTRLVCCAVDNRAMKSIDIPAEWRERIQGYMARCDSNRTGSDNMEVAHTPVSPGGAKEVMN